MPEQTQAILTMVPPSEAAVVAHAEGLKQHLLETRRQILTRLEVLERIELERDDLRSRLELAEKDLAALGWSAPVIPDAQVDVGSVLGLPSQQEVR